MRINVKEIVGVDKASYYNKIGSHLYGSTNCNSRNKISLSKNLH